MPYVRTIVFALVCLALPAAVREAGAEDPAPAAPAAEVKIPWVKVWADAKAQAKREKKDLLIDFTGSDWCTWCIRLEEEVFSQAKFLETATKQFVFVYLDFPDGADKKKEVADPALNESLKTSFMVGGYPTIVLANADGQPYASTGYQAGGPEPYLTHLSELKAGGAKVAALLAKGKQDLAAFKPGFEVLAQQGLLGYADYAWVVDHAEKQDPDGSKGLKETVQAERARQRSAVEEAALMKLVKAATSEEVLMPQVHEFLKTSKDLSGRLLWQASMKVGSWLLQKKEFEEAKRMFRLPLRDPEVVGDARRTAAIENALKMVDEAQNPKPAEPDPKPVDPK